MRTPLRTYDPNNVLFVIHVVTLGDLFSNSLTKIEQGWSLRNVNDSVETDLVKRNST